MVRRTVRLLRDRGVRKWVMGWLIVFLLLMLAVAAFMRAFRRRLDLLGSQRSCLAMSDHSHDSARRYFVDGSGQRVLVGLTIEETAEFKTLDVLAAVGKGSGQVLWDESDRLGSRRHSRWLELYAKHEQAWCQWMANTRADRRGNLPAVN